MEVYVDPPSSSNAPSSISKRKSSKQTNDRKRAVEPEREVPQSKLTKLTETGLKSSVIDDEAPSQEEEEEEKIHE